MNKIDYKELYLQQKKDLNAKINTNKILIREKKMLQQKIDKAIEYCEEITSREIDISDTDYELGEDFTARDILKILRGEDER